MLHLWMEVTVKYTAGVSGNVTKSLQFYGCKTYLLQKKTKNI